MRRHSRCRVRRGGHCRRAVLRRRSSNFFVGRSTCEGSASTIAAAAAIGAAAAVSRATQLSLAITVLGV